MKRHSCRCSFGSISWRCSLLMLQSVGGTYVMCVYSYSSMRCGTVQYNGRKGLLMYPSLDVINPRKSKVRDSNNCLTASFLSSNYQLIPHINFHTSVCGAASSLSPTSFTPPPVSAPLSCTAMLLLLSFPLF